MSFSRRLTVGASDDILIHNQALIHEHLYNRLLDICKTDLIILQVEPDTNAPASVQYITVIGSHNRPENVLMSREAMVEQPSMYRFTRVKTLPIITSLTIRIMDNHFCLSDPLQAIQDYIQDYHILYKGMSAHIPTDVEYMTAPILIEDMAPAAIGRVPNGEVEIDLIYPKVEQPHWTNDQRLPEPLVATTPHEAPPQIQPTVEAPAVETREEARNKRARAFEALFAASRALL